MFYKIWVLAIGFGLVAAQTKPNIIFILTDDQDTELGSLEPMERTLALIADQGATLENAFVSTPVCCPSRSSILTGLYIHSHGSINNTANGGCSSLNWQNSFEPKTYAKRLHDLGYRTFYAGKYLNMYGYSEQGGTQHVPVGWDWWQGLVGNSIYYNYTLSINGTAVNYGDTEEDYLTDVIRDQALQFLQQTYVTNGDKPFLMVLATPTAHDPFTPAPRHRGSFSGLNAPRTPHFNIPATNRKHWLLRLPPETLPQEIIDNIDGVYRNRFETLLAVDEMVEDIIQRLNETNLLDNTYVVYSSDHGFHFGQFAHPWDKRLPYEFDIRVPMLIRGPGIAAGTIIKDPVVSVDIAPTFLHMAGLDVQNETDGVSFLPLLQKPPASEFDRTFLVEFRGEWDESNNECWDDKFLSLCRPDIGCKCMDAKNNTYVCVRHLSNRKNDIFCRFEDDENFAELYDLNEDPYQLENLAIPQLRDPSPYLEKLSCFNEIVDKKESIHKCF